MLLYKFKSMHYWTHSWDFFLLPGDIFQVFQVWTQGCLAGGCNPLSKKPGADSCEPQWASPRLSESSWWHLARLHQAPGSVSEIRRMRCHQEGYSVLNYPKFQTNSSLTVIISNSRVKQYLISRCEGDRMLCSTVSLPHSSPLFTPLPLTLPLLPPSPLNHPLTLTHSSLSFLSALVELISPLLQESLRMANI